MNVDINNYLPFLAALLGGGVGVTLAAQLLKKTFKDEEEAVIHTLVVALTVVAAVAQYIIQLKGKLPTEVLGVSTLTIYGVSQAVYKYSKYANNFLAKVYGPDQAAATEAKVESKASEVMSGVENVVHDAKNLEQDFA